MDLPLYIAKRYLVSKKSNNAINIISWISIAAIAVTTAVLIVILSAMNGLTNTVAGLYNVFEPDLRITPAHGKRFRADAGLLEKVRHAEGVSRVSISYTDKALLRNIDRQVLVTVKGVDSAFAEVTRIDSALVEGTLPLRRSDVLLGRGIADQLAVNLGALSSDLSFFSPAAKGGGFGDEQFNEQRASPSGIFSLNDEFDYQFVFTTLRDARRLFDASPSDATALELKCTDPTAARRALQEMLGKDFVIKSRYELNDLLFKSLETEKLATFIILAFILVIATFNIIGSLTMLIIEKKRDIRTLFSLGAPAIMIRRIFMREGLLLTGVGAVAGLLIGLLVCWLQVRFHLVKFGSGFIIPYYPIDLQWVDFVRIFLLIMAIGFVAVLYPVRVFARAELVR